MFKRAVTSDESFDKMKENNHETSTQIQSYVLSSVMLSSMRSNWFIEQR